MQLYMEGPFDKTITFVVEQGLAVDIQIPGVYPDVPELGYLGGHTLGELLSVEQQATEAALAQRGRMSMTISLPRVNERALGGLFMLLEIATVYAGGLYGVDPMNQPGVELGKQLTYGIIGRQGYEKFRDEWNAREPKNEDWVI
jgi:glucose-6-phosphate isomerase